MLLIMDKKFMILISVTFMVIVLTMVRDLHRRHNSQEGAYRRRKHLKINKDHDGKIQKEKVNGYKEEQSIHGDKVQKWKANSDKKGQHMLVGLKYIKHDNEWNNIHIMKQGKNKNISETNHVAGMHVLIFALDKPSALILGGLFEEHPDYFYISEALALYHKNLKQLPSNHYEINKSSCQKEGIYCRLNYLYNCQISQYMSEADEVYNAKTVKYWYPKVFAKHQEGKATQYKTLDDVCSQKYKHVAVTITRGYSIESIIPLMKSGIKVIYITRDPRAVLGTLVKKKTSLPKDDKLLKQASNACKRGNQDLTFLSKLQMKNGNELLELFNEQFRIVRYEDLERHFEDMAAKVHSFIETRLEGKDVKAKASKVESNPRAAKGPSVAIKISKQKKAPDDWRKALDMKTIIKLQLQCRSSMNMLGYKLVSNTTGPKELQVLLPVQVEKVPYYMSP